MLWQHATLSLHQSGLVFCNYQKIVDWSQSWLHPNKPKKLDWTRPGGTTFEGCFCLLILVTHDESTFFQKDLNKSHWAHKGNKPTPQSIGDGQSLLVSDFLTSDWGCLCDSEGEKYEVSDFAQKVGYVLATLFEQRSQNPFQAWSQS